MIFRMIFSLSAPNGLGIFVDYSISEKLGPSKYYFCNDVISIFPYDGACILP